MRDNYKKLTTEIDRFFDLLSFLSEIQIGIRNSGTYSVIDCEIRDKDEFDLLFKSLKSNLIIMLYNLVESTVRLSMNAYYDDFNSKMKNYTTAIDEIRKLWVKYGATSFKENQINNQVFGLIEQAIDKEYYIYLDFEKFHLSGNADLKEIKSILSFHGISYEESEFKTYGGSLRSIKEMRNSLAHGNVSFEDNGRNLAISDIQKYKEQTYSCLEYFMSIVKNNFVNENIKKPTNRKWRMKSL